MQFITNGPDVPDSLLEAHEEGRVVFFCGAGISYPAKLPGFADLVIKIRDELGADFSAAESALFKSWQYDRTLDSMEWRLTSGRIGVRKALAKVLTTDLSRPEATQTHAALLQLAKSAKGQRRLVTTNFDRIFEHVVSRDQLGVESYAAPMLPVPKPSRWDGIVYLHGLLPESPSESALQRLIVTSGDFGLAYLTERWAARFVGELFRNFVVCFVGYSLNDPILRYMMDALAADRRLGEATPQAYAFGDYKAGQQARARENWSAKGVEPVLYESKNGDDGHAALHQTLIAWADMHRDGALGKEALVSKYASYPPQQSTKEDDYVGRVVWAICHPSGMPARRFAELTPPPPLSWLEPLSGARFGVNDVSRFDLPATAVNADSPTFSVLSRPTPARVAPPMRLAHRGDTSANGNLDQVMFQLSRWLLRHLDSPDLVIWIAERGGRLHAVWQTSIEQHLRRLEVLKKTQPEAYKAELEASPSAVPGPLLRPFWDLLLTDRVQAEGAAYNFYGWLQLFESQGMSWIVRHQLQKYLAPKLTLHKPYWGSASLTGAQRRSEIVGWELTLTAEYVSLVLKELREKPEWRAALPSLLPNFTSLLMDAVSLTELLKDDNGYDSPTHYFRPSIAEHQQNTNHNEWTVLIDLLHDAWLETVKVDPEQAGAVARSWWATPYRLFKRLALFAASYPSAVRPAVVFGWIQSDDSGWLWSEEARREVMPWLRSGAPHLDAEAAVALQLLILAGPPATLTTGWSNPEALSEHYDEIEFLALMNLVVGGMPLASAAQQRYDDLATRHPDLKLTENHREEFTSWMSAGNSAMSEDMRHSPLPRDLADLVEALRGGTPDGFWQSDDWRELCVQDIDLASRALIALARDGVWPSSRWQTALSAWAFPEAQPLTWDLLSSTLLGMPDEDLVETRHTVSDWLRAMVAGLTTNESIFFELCARVIAVCPEDEPKSESHPVDDAINHPIGKVTDAILRLWYTAKPKDDQTLPLKVAEFLADISGGEAANLVHGRVLIASNIVSLYRADRDWVKKHFLHFFDWHKSATQAQAVWEGFLWSPRLHRALLEAIKVSFLETAGRYKALGSHSNQFVDLLLSAALEAEDLFTRDELVRALAALPQAGLDHAATLLARSVRNAGDPAAYWRNRVQPFIRAAWPKDASRHSQGISTAFAKLCIWAEGQIADAFSELGAWLTPVQHPGSIYHQASEGALGVHHPREILALLNVVTKNDATWVADELKTCLDQIRKGEERLTATVEFKRLEELVRRCGH